ncbi:MAG: hypothetical protein KF856_00790 [Cyclobacteriaceae bacterium]|nr:hypothetical protein [Cyclobacteriaceae bacterium]
MKIKAVVFVFGLLHALVVQAQPDSPGGYRNMPIIVKVQFHNLAMPFKDVKYNFNNVGLGIGTELSYNIRNTWVQQLTATWHANKTVGNGIMLYSQVVWRPNIRSGLYTEIKAGGGYKYAFRPVESYKQNNQGKWEAVGRKGKGMLVLPLGVSLGYQSLKTRAGISPFVSYQFLLVSGYNTSVPLVPETLIQVGSRIHLKK